MDIQTKYTKGITLFVLGVATLSGLIGHTGIAIAGIAIYLTGKELGVLDD